MIAVDTSALVAIALAEPEEEAFNRVILAEGAIIGAPSLVEVHFVLAGRGTGAAVFIDKMLARSNLITMPFDLPHYRAATAAFERYGKGRGHPAQLNYGDCLAYAVAKTHGVPLLYKGGDFALTDIPPALT